MQLTGSIYLTPQGPGLDLSAVDSNKRPKTTLKTGLMVKNTYSSWRIPGLVPNTYLEAHSNFLIPVSGAPTPSSDPHMFLRACGTYTHTRRRTHTFKNQTPQANVHRHSGLSDEEHRQLFHKI